MDYSLVDFAEYFLVSIQEDEELVHLDKVERSTHDLYLNVKGIGALLLH